MKLGESRPSVSGIFNYDNYLGSLMFRCKEQQKQQGATDARAVRPSPEEGTFPCASRTPWQIDAVLPIVEIRSRWSIRLSPGSSRTRAAHAREAGPNFQ